MTALIANNQIASSIIPPIKVALVGVTMIQQSLLEFYFATQEGSQRYCVVLGKEADAYLTNFDELGSIEAWEHLYAQENKPTLVLSNRHEIINNYIYISKPLTPKALADASLSIHHLLENTVGSQKKTSLSSSDELLQFRIDPSTKSPYVEDITIPNKISIDAILEEEQTEKKVEELGDEFEFIDEIDADIAFNNAPFFEEKKELEQELDAFASIEEITIEEKPDQVKPDDVDEKLELDELISFKPSSKKQEEDAFPPHENKDLSDEEDIFAGLDILDEITFEDNTSKEEDLLSFDSKFSDNSASQPSKTKEKSAEPSDNLSSPDELQLFLDELNEKTSQQKKEKKAANSSEKESKQKLRWSQLCGGLKNSSYEKKSGINTHFKLEETLLPYLVDTISFTERAGCWMELAYKPLSILINPESQLIYSNFSLKDPLFVQICNGKALEELIEYLEVDAEKINQVKAKQSAKKLFSYDIPYFLWTLSLLVSHGRLPEKVNPDEGMSVTNWLSLNKVEKFPYILQIAAVFNQHHASLNEAAVWMKLPKRYVYAFYNGVAALDLIDKNPKKSLIRKS
ncbi:MAG: hypothetical protein KAH03_05680 [Cocleimonas sp.]|nr:hypothetical protein [Cocleimonas sp.]